MTIRRGLCITLLVTLAILIASPVFAYLYRAPLTISETNGTDYTGLGVTCSTNVSWLVDNGFITTATALDTRVETYGGTEQIHMMASDRVMVWVPSLDGDSQLNWYLTTGNTELSNFPVIVGHGGSVTISDHADLELGNNFSIEFDGYVDTSIANAHVVCPGIVANATSTENSLTTSHTVSLPSGIEDGNLLLVVFQVYGSVGLGITPPGGWTELDYDSDDVQATWLGYRVANGAEGGTITFSTDVNALSAHQTFRITNYIGVPESSFDSGLTESTSPNPPSLDPSWDTSLTLWIAGFGAQKSSSASLSSYPSGYTNGLFTKTSTGYVYVGTATKVSTSGSEDPGTYTLSVAVYWRGFTIAIQGSLPSQAIVEKEESVYLYSNNGTINVGVYAAQSLIVSATVPSGVYEVNVWANVTHLGIDLEGTTENITALGGASVPDNSYNWTVSIPSFDYYEHSVNGTLEVWYLPNTMVLTTVLIDRSGNGHHGTIAWGSNPAGVSATLGSLTVPESTVIIDEEEEFRQTTHEVAVTDWFREPAIGTTLANHPLRPLVTIMSDYTTINEIQAWRFLGLALLLLLTVSAAVMVRGHLLLAGLVCGGTIALLVQQTVWPGWTLVFIIPAIIAGVMAERTPSIG